MARIFTPPGRIEQRGKHPLFGRLPLEVGVSLLKNDGLYRQVSDPADEDIRDADLAFIGGHVYLVTNSEAASLTAAGYGEWVESPGGGYGSGSYGDGLFGESEAVDITSGYGGGSYGGGEYGED